MYEIRIYRVVGKSKFRTAKIKNAAWFGFFAWCRLWFTLKNYSVKLSGGSATAISSPHRFAPSQSLALSYFRHACLRGSAKKPLHRFRCQTARAARPTRQRATSTRNEGACVSRFACASKIETSVLRARGCENTFCRKTDLEPAGWRGERVGVGEI
jgi:hypothetical protein